MKTSIIKAFKVLLLSVVLFSFQGCTKNLGLPIVIVKNNSNHAYEISVDGDIKGNVSGNSTREFTLSTGERKLKATQTTGYILFPTIVEVTYNLRLGDKITWSIP